MNSQIIKPAFFILYLFIFQTFSRDSVALENNSPDSVNTRGKILLAWRDSDFKTAVAEKAQQLLEELNVQIETVDIRVLKKMDTGNYDAIIIINRVRAWHLNFHTRKFFKKIEQAEREKVIMITTALTSWKTKEKDIDAITVASEENSVNYVAKMIFKKIILLLALD